MTQAYSDRIQALLEPLVGAFVARRAVNFQCKSMGITPEQIGPSNLAALADKIGRALEVQGKQADAKAIVERIRSL